MKLGCQDRREEVREGWINPFELDIGSDLFACLAGFLLASSAGGAQASDLSSSGFCVSILLDWSEVFHILSFSSKMVSWASQHRVEFVRCLAIGNQQLLGQGGCLGGYLLRFIKLFAPNPVEGQLQIPPAARSEALSLEQVFIYPFSFPLWSYGRSELLWKSGHPGLKCEADKNLQCVT